MKRTMKIWGLSILILLIFRCTEKEAVLLEDKEFKKKDNTLLIASFNALRLGEKEKDYESLAKIISKFDLTGLQEVMNEKGLKKLKGYLEKVSKKEWEYIISETSTGSEGYREYYAFIYKKEKIQETRKIGFYKEKSENEFMREPYGVYFKSKKFDFVYVIAHSIFGDEEKQRLIEASNYLDVYNYFFNFTGENDIIIAGDFNVPANHRAFKGFLKESGTSYLIEPEINPTTISEKGLVSSYDNFFINRDKTEEFTGIAGVYNFIKNNNYSAVKKYISDHLLIFSEYYIDEDLD